MIFYKKRSGGSFFRFRAISGYIKILFNRDSELEGSLSNKMKAKYTIKK